MSIETQMQIKENSTELNEFLQDLTSWEHAVKEKEKKLGGSANKTIPAVRGQKQSYVEKKGIVRDGATEKVPDKAAAAHTYDYFRDKWDRFDVDAALAEVDEEPQKPSPKKVARTTKTKPPGANVEVQKGPPKATVNEPASNTYGATRGSSSGSLAGFGSLSSSYGLENEPVPDAMSEKDLGNEFFKEGKYVNAIECYSRSIALQPTAVAFANRAMALLKIRRYADAEVDCTEAISLDDRYTKAYSRRGTARKELQKYFAAVEDFEFALRLEPENKELKKQYVDAKDIHEKFASKTKPVQKKVPVLVEELSSPSVPPQSSTNSLERGDFSARKQSADKSTVSAGRKLDERIPVSSFPSTKTVVASSSLISPETSALKSGNVSFYPNDVASGASASELPVASTKSRAVPTETTTSQVASSAQPRSSDETLAASRRSNRLLETPPSAQLAKATPSAQPESSDEILAWSRKLDASRPPSMQSTKMEEPSKQGKVDSKLPAQVIAPSQAAVDRAAMNATAGLARNMVAPKTSYEFEATWKGFANDRHSQSRLLKIMEPSSLPKVFKDLLGAPLLMDIMNSLPLLLPDDTRLVLHILENLVKVGRFDMTILFLTTKDRTVMRKLWEGMLATEELSINEETKLNALRSKYKL